MLTGGDFDRLAKDAMDDDVIADHKRLGRVVGDERRHVVPMGRGGIEVGDNSPSAKAEGLLGLLSSHGLCSQSDFQSLSDWLLSREC